MYSVSNAYLEKAKDIVQEHRLTGTIGSVSFTENNIVSGTFNIQKQSTDTNNIVLGSAYIGQLTATFTGLNIDRGAWYKKNITVSFGLKVGVNTWEDVPLGIYKIKEVHVSAEGVEVVAYDKMWRFDKVIKKKKNTLGFITDTMYDFIDLACTKCHVTLGMTEQQINALPNGYRSQTDIEVYGDANDDDFANDIETYRDLIHWCAQTMGCFATINRSGQLVFKQYTQTVLDEISDNNRLAGAVFDDYTTHFTGLYFTDMDTNDDTYYGYDVDELLAQIAETSGDLEQAQDDLADNAAAQIALDEQYAQGQITEQEYLTQKAALQAEAKSLQKSIKKLTKRLGWLEDELHDAQDDDEGATMDCGANPFLQYENLTKRDNTRRRVLAALSDISYTPFSASLVCGAHYDLGDIIRFNGGHADNDICCVMSWSYTHNQGTEIEGFGVDPSQQLVKNKNAKAVKATNTNAVNATNTANEDDIILRHNVDDSVTMISKRDIKTDFYKRMFYMWAYNQFYTYPSWTAYRVTISSEGTFKFAVCGIEPENARVVPEGDPENPIEIAGYKEVRIYLVAKLQDPDTVVTEDNRYPIVGKDRIAGIIDGPGDFGMSWGAFIKYGGTDYYVSSMGAGTTFCGLYSTTVFDDRQVDYWFDDEAEMYNAIALNQIVIPDISWDFEAEMATDTTGAEITAILHNIDEVMKGNGVPDPEPILVFGDVDVLTERTFLKIKTYLASIATNVNRTFNRVNDVRIFNNDLSVDFSILSDYIAKIPIFHSDTVGDAASNYGLVPIDTNAIQKPRFLRNDGTWQEINSGGGGGGRQYIGSLIERVMQAVSNINASSYDSNFGEPWKAFNGVSPSNLRNPNNVWLPTQNEANPWIQYDFGLGNEKYFTQISIKCFSNYSGAWTGYIDILGSNDGVTWENILATGDKVSVTANYQQFTEIDIDLDDANLWRYIRLRGESAFNVYYQPAFIIDEIYVYGGIETSGGGGGLNFSLIEQLVGKWIDDSDLYQLTVATGGNAPANTNLHYRMQMVDYDTLLYTYREAITHYADTFVTGSVADSVSVIDCTFEPTHLLVVIPFTNSNLTYALYCKDISTTTSIWWIVPEHGKQILTLGAQSGETGICDILQTGFKVRAHAGNVLGVTCKYSAWKLTNNNSYSGTFTTGSSIDSVVDVNCGFMPDYIMVFLPFSPTSPTYAIYDVDIDDLSSLWMIYAENQVYKLTLGAASGETGICEITNNGFRFRAHANNTLNVSCTFIACQK